MAPSDKPRRNLQFQIGHVFSTDVVALLEGLCRLDRPLHINLRRITLDIEAGGSELEGRAQIAGQGIPIELSEEDVDIPLVRLNNAVVAKETRLSQQRPSTPWRAAAGCVDFTMVPVLAVSPPVCSRDTQSHTRLALIESEHLGAGGSGPTGPNRPGMKPAQGYSATRRGGNAPATPSR